jgi:hypothetical protein
MEEAKKAEWGICKRIRINSHPEVEDRDLAKRKTVRSGQIREACYVCIAWGQAQWAFNTSSKPLIWQGGSNPQAGRQLLL